MNQNYKKILIVLWLAVLAAAVTLAFKISSARKISVESSDRPLIETRAANIPNDVNDLIIGNQGAPLTITEFLDFNTKESREVHAILSGFTKNNPLKIRLLVKDFPDQGLFASDSEKPHLAAFCAAKQGSEKYQIFVDALIKSKEKINQDETLRNIASQVGLNQASFDSCLLSSEARTRVEASVTLAEELGLKKAPQIFINNRQVNYLEEINLNDLLEEILKEY